VNKDENIKVLSIKV